MSLTALQKLQEHAKKARDEASVELKTAQSQLMDIKGKISEVDAQLSEPHPAMMSAVALQLYGAKRQALQSLSEKSKAALDQARAEISVKQAALTSAAINEAKYTKLIARKLQLALEKQSKAEQRTLDDMAAQVWLRNPRAFD